jgi:Sec-independent protein translocase protein TatA
MNIFRLAFELFALYLLYKLIFDFIIPVAKTTKQVKKQFNDMNAQMQEKMNEQNARQNQQQFHKTTVTENATKTKPSSDDYIEFEELK